MTRERAPWWRRRLGAWGAACATLVLLSIGIGIVGSRTAPWLTVQAVLLATAAACYVIGLVRSPD